MKNLKNKFFRFLNLILTCSLVFLCSCSLVFAQEEIDIGEVVVTATKIEKPIREIPQTVSIITKEDIEKLENRTLGDVLREVSGVDIRSWGALGALNTITLRGMSEKQVLFLLDGIPIQEAQGGGLDLSKISLHNVEKIEVLKGPASALYGANALGGVVNIITKKAEKLTEFKISSGTYRTRKYFTGYGGKFGNLGYLISAERQTSSGVRENSDYEGDSLNIKLNYLQNKNDYTLSYTQYEGEKGVPGSLTRPSKLARQWDDERYLHFLSKIRLRENYELNLKLYNNDTERKFYDGRKTSIHKNNIHGLELQNNIKLNEENFLSFGYERQNIEGDSTETGKHKLRNNAYYLQFENKNFEDTIINFGIREDTHEIYGKKTSPRLSLVYYPDENTLCRFVYGEAFRAPTFNDLYWPRTPWAEGNPNLKPEDGESFEFAAEYRKDAFLFKLSFFRNNVKNLIAWARHPDRIWRPSNIDEAEITGYEIELSNKINNNLSINLNSTIIDAIDIKKNRKLTYRPDLKFNYGLRYSDNKINFAIQGRFTDKRVYEYDRITGKPRYLPSNKIYDAKITRNFGNFNISVSGKNIFDKEYQEVYDYPMLRRTWNLEVGYKL